VAPDVRGGKSKKTAPAAAAPAADPMTEARARATQNPGEPFWPYRLAQLELEKQRPEPAETALKQAIARDATYAPALTALSRLYYQQGRHAEALAMLEPVRAQQVSLPPADRAAVLAGLAMHQAALGDEVTARATLDRLTRDERDHVPGVTAWLAVRDTSAAAARHATDVALRMEPKTAANHNNRGIALLRSGDPEGAAKAFERAIELDPSLAGPYYNLAILERWYRLDRVAAATRFRAYWSRSHADPDSLYAELGNAPAAPIAEEGPHR
jgi:tetratricopeptide (TPR) repeat protein